MEILSPLEIKQSVDCGPKCLQLIGQYYGKEHEVDFLCKISNVDYNGATMAGLSRAAAKIGFVTMPVEISLEKLVNDVPLPCILHWGKCHFVVLYKIDVSMSNQDNSYFIGDPVWGIKCFNQADFASMWLKECSDDGYITSTGIALLIKPDDNGL